MEMMRSICLLLSLLLSNNLLIPVISAALITDQKNFFPFPGQSSTTPPSFPGTPPSAGDPPSGTPPSHGGGGYNPTPTPSHGGGGYTPTPSTPSHGGGGYTPTPSTPSTPPSSNCGVPPTHGTTPRTHDPSHGGRPSTPSHGGRTPSTPSHGGSTPSTPSHGGSTPSTPSHGGSTPSTPSHGGSTPSTPSHGGSYNPPPSSGGGYSYPPPTSGGSPPTPIISTPPIDPGTPSIPTPPYIPAPFPSTGGTCDFWRSHPGLIWGVLGWWGTMGGVFGLTSVPAVPGFSPTMSLQEALSNTRRDGLGSLYREGTASFLNSMVNHRFPYTTNQVRQRFTAALTSNHAASSQARLFRLANEGRLKPRN